MADGGTKSMRQHIVAGGRDVLVVCAVLTLMGGLLQALFKPHWAPYQALPSSVADLKTAVDGVQAMLAQNARPLVVETQGNGMIVSGGVHEAGGLVTILYSVRRNVACDGRYLQRFFNADTGTEFSGGWVDSIKAPTSDTFNPFKLDLRLPADLPDGRYIYIPRLVPIDCGVYGPLSIAPSEIFTVGVM
jgi:hypothetical protein